MTHRIGAKGQVVIPRQLRQAAGLHPGTEVDFDLRGEQVVVSALAPRRPMAGRFPRTGMAARLLEDRAREPR